LGALCVDGGLAVIGSRLDSDPFTFFVHSPIAPSAMFKPIILHFCGQSLGHDKQHYTRHPRRPGCFALNASVKFITEGSEDFNRRKTKGFEQKVAKVAKGTED
jgi:hypothetical protein